MRNIIAYTLVASICTEHKPQLNWFKRLFHWFFKISPIEYSYVVTVKTSDIGHVRIGCMVLLDLHEVALFVKQVDRFVTEDKITLITPFNLMTPLQFNQDGSLVVFSQA